MPFREKKGKSHKRFNGRKKNGFAKKRKTDFFREKHGFPSRFSMIFARFYSIRAGKISLNIEPPKALLSTPTPLIPLCYPLSIINYYLLKFDLILNCVHVCCFVLSSLFMFHAERMSAHYVGLKQFCMNESIGKHWLTVIVRRRLKVLRQKIENI